MEGVEDVVRKRVVGNPHTIEDVLLDTRKHLDLRRKERELVEVVVLEEIDNDPKGARKDREQPRGALKGQTKEHAL